jgi:hypothetical protein
MGFFSHNETPQHVLESQKRLRPLRMGSWRLLGSQGLLGWIYRFDHLCQSALHRRHSHIPQLFLHISALCGPILGQCMTIWVTKSRPSLYLAGVLNSETLPNNGGQVAPVLQWPEQHDYGCEDKDGVLPGRFWPQSKVQLVMVADKERGGGRERREKHRPRDQGQRKHKETGIWKYSWTKSQRGRGEGKQRRVLKRANVLQNLGQRRKSALSQ